MYARRTILAAIIAATVCTMATAQAELSITFFDKRIYVPGVEIPVEVSIRNDTPQAWRFKLADEKRLSVGFDVRTLGNRPLEASDSWKRAMASSSPAFYRELALQPGEEYSFVEDLRNFVSIPEPGTYVVSCTMWPELGSLSDSAPFIRSNALTLSVRPGSPAPGSTEIYRTGTAEILRAERISPDEVVGRTIRARQKNLWNEFFLYLDLERLLRNNQDKLRSYDRESDDGRRRLLETYRTDLMQSVVDADIVVIPTSFVITETRYGPLYGSVTVIQKFAYDGFSMIKEYTYELEKQDDIWYIVSYVVRNKGTE
ncbi:MAG: hypothetical protein ABIJ86_00120 [Spirochaetota bacterium]